MTKARAHSARHPKPRVLKNELAGGPDLRIVAPSLLDRNTVMAASSTIHGDQPASVPASLDSSLETDGGFLVYDEAKVQRTLGVFLISLFCLGPLAAMLPADNDSRLPACCRRHGAHHCAMADSGMAQRNQPASGPPIFTAPSHCPLYPTAGFATIGPIQALTSSAQGRTILLAQSHSPAATRAAARMSQLRTRADRGPPASILG